MWYIKVDMLYKHWVKTSNKIKLKEKKLNLSQQLHFQTIYNKNQPDPGSIIAYLFLFNVVYFLFIESAT